MPTLRTSDAFQLNTADINCHYLPLFPPTKQQKTNNFERLNKYSAQNTEMKIHKKYEISAGKTSTIYKHEKKPRAINHPLILKKTRKMREKTSSRFVTCKPLYCDQAS